MPDTCLVTAIVCLCKSISFTGTYPRRHSVVIHDDLNIVRSVSGEVTKVLEGKSMI